MTEYTEVTEGLTTGEPLEKVYVRPPLGLMVKESPVQMVPLLTVSSGKLFTVTNESAEDTDTQPKELVPMTLYQVVEEGETTLEPPEYVYVLAPLATIVKEEPLQMVPLLTVMTGKGFTVTLAMAAMDETQPKELVPVTE